MRWPSVANVSRFSMPGGPAETGLSWVNCSTRKGGKTAGRARSQIIATKPRRNARTRPESTKLRLLQSSRLRTALFVAGAVSPASGSESRIEVEMPENGTGGETCAAWGKKGFGEIPWVLLSPSDSSTGNGGNAVEVTDTGAMNRYPRFARVSTNLGFSAESERASRTFFIATARARSKSTVVSGPQT